MQSGSIGRNSRKQALQQAAGAELPVDTYDAIRWALHKVNRHSFLQLPASLQQQEAQRKPRAVSKSEPAPASASPSPGSGFLTREKIEGRMLELNDVNIAYLVVPHFSPTDDADGVQFETRLQQLIAALDQQHPRGWIIDLRGNGGGNMWPMLAGLGPLLGEGKLGAFHDGGGKDSNWLYRDGTVGTEGSENWKYPRVEGEPYRVAGNPAVAVLIDGGTASSGEAVAIAFRGRSRTRFFGEPTMEVSTNNTNFLLSDGANMILTIGVQVDRDGNEYQDGIQPDASVASPGQILAPERDAGIVAAEQWLASQSGESTRGKYSYRILSCT